MLPWSSIPLPFDPMEDEHHDDSRIMIWYLKIIFIKIRVINIFKKLIKICLLIHVV